MNAAELKELHETLYPDDTGCHVYACPGRINLIGEHVDYNGGHVMPAAIDSYVYLCISKSNADFLSLSDHGFNTDLKIMLDAYSQGDFIMDRIWIYQYGALKMIAESLKQAFSLSYYSAIPQGAGVSSSAAMTIVTLYGMSHMLDIKIDNIEMAKLGQRVERDFASVSCGIMDQFAVIHGKRSKAMLLDTSDLSYRYCEINPEKVCFILIDSGIKHSLRESGYNERRKESENALLHLKNIFPSLEYLCGLGMNDLPKALNVLKGDMSNRVLHVVSENQRTIDFYQSMTGGDLNKAGIYLYESHESLRDLYEVSTPELDEMVEWTKEIDGVYGARMMGGGFGGCTINMVSPSYSRSFISKMSDRFEKKFGRQPDILECNPADGVGEIIAE